MKPLVGLLALLVASTAFGQVYGFPGATSNVRYRTVATGADATHERAGMFVLDEPTSWGSYWRENHRGPAPSLERDFFLRWRLVAIHAGGRPTGGYGLGVQRIVRNIDRATIFGIEAIPPRNSRPARGATAPWILIQVERGAFGFDLQTRQLAGYAGGATLGGGNGPTTVNMGNGVTVTFGPGGGGCDHCDRRGRGRCACERGDRGCDCRG